MAIIGWNPQTEREIAEFYANLHGKPGDEEEIQRQLAGLREVRTSVTIDGVRYKVPNIAYHIPKTLQLPDGRQAKLTGGWLESMPPQGWADIITDALFPDTDVYEAVLA